MALAPVIKVEYQQQGAIVTTFLSNIPHLRPLCDLAIQQAKQSFPAESWNYRITYNCKEYVSGADEICCLVGTDSIQINGVTYVASQGVSHVDILAVITERIQYLAENHSF